MRFLYQETFEFIKFDVLEAIERFIKDKGRLKQKVFYGAMNIFNETDPKYS